MKISAKAEYACLAAVTLARVRPDEPPLRIREIAEAEGLSERYLVQILLQLKGAGLVVSTRGASGGYRLSRPPEQISLAEVLTAIDGPSEPPTVREESGPAAHALATVWREVHLAEQGVLERTTLDRLLAQSAPREWVI